MSEAQIGFVATKPFQVITSLAIACQCSHQPARLCVVPTFADADGVVRRLVESDSDFVGISCARSRPAAIFRLASRGVSRIFLDSDVGVKTPLAMRAARIRWPYLRFSLYEEGLSLFEPRADERPNRLLEALGATATLGEDRLTDDVWSYTPESVRPRLPAKGLTRIDTGLAAFVSEHRPMLSQVFWPSCDEDVSAWHGRACSIYLSPWRVDPRALEYLSHTTMYSVCKLHPHIRRQVTLPTGIDQVLSSVIPAELIITALATSFELVEVLHHGTTVERYLDLPNIHFINLGELPARSL